MFFYSTLEVRCRRNEPCVTPSQRSK